MADPSLVLRFSEIFVSLVWVAYLESSIKLNEDFLSVDAMQQQSETLANAYLALSQLVCTTSNFCCLFLKLS